MQSFTFSIPQNIIFGKGSIKQLPSIAEKLGGKHAYIISGPVLEKMGMPLDGEDTVKRQYQPQY